MRILFSAGPTFHIQSPSQLPVRPRDMNSAPALLCQNRAELQPDSRTEWSKDQLGRIPAPQSLSFFFPVSLSCKCTPGLPSCSENYFWWKYPENDTFPQENQFGLISFYMVKKKKIVQSFMTSYTLHSRVSLVVLTDPYWGLWITALPASRHSFSVGIICCHAATLLFQTL